MTAVDSYITVDNHIGYDFESEVIMTLLEWGADPTVSSRDSTPLATLLNINPNSRLGQSTSFRAIITTMFRIRDSEFLAPRPLDVPVSPVAVEICFDEKCNKLWMFLFHQL